MTAFLLNIVHNLILLLSLGMVVILLRHEMPLRKQLGPVLIGVLFGAAAIYSMIMSFPLVPGVIFDGRSIVLMLAGLFGGIGAAAMAMLIAGLYRLFIGGPGVYAGVATILVSGLFGIYCRSLIKPRNWPPTACQIWCVGFVGHLLVLACMLLLPPPMQIRTIVYLLFPYVFAYPLVLVLLGTVMAREENWLFDLTRLQHTDWLSTEAQKLTLYGSFEYKIAENKLIATPNFYRLLGLPEKSKEVTIQKIFERLHKEDRTALPRALENSLKQKEAFDVQARLLTYDGREVWMRVVGKHFFAKDKARHIVGNLIDITRRKTIELQLRDSKSQLQAILDHTQVLICICDLEGNVLLANQRFQIFGMQPEDLIGRPLYEFLPRNKAIEQWVDDLLILQTGEQVEFEEILWHADGTVHTYLTSKFLLSTGDVQKASICYIATDISDLRQTLYEKQHLSDELQAKNDELERFTYTVSHDLKAPLLTISSYSSLLENVFPSVKEGPDAEILDHIRDAAAKMRQMIDGVLELSRVGKTIGTMAPVDLNQVVEDALLLLDGERRASNAMIVTAPDLPTVMGDSLRLGQVMQNLLQNTFKFFDPDRSPQIDIDWFKDPEGNIVVTVRDNGRGLAEHEKSRIFEIFVHGAGQDSGTGVGLALVRRIMEKHGGTVWAESPGPGSGTTFSLRFCALPDSEGSDFNWE